MISGGWGGFSVLQCKGEMHKDSVPLSPSQEAPRRLSCLVDHYQYRSEAVYSLTLVHFRTWGSGNRKNRNIKIPVRRLLQLC